MKEFLDNQYKNLFLWVPLVIAFGGALYFSLNTEPGFHFPVLITILLIAIIFKHRNLFIRFFALFLFGFFYAMSFTHITDTPQIQDSFGDIHISGTIQDIDYLTEKTRLLIRIPMEQINGEVRNKTANIRVSLSNMDSDINIGDKIYGDAVLFHPSPKYAPDSFDFARWAYFSNISATGFFKNYEIEHENKDLKNIRTYIHNKSNSFLTDSLVLGYKRTLPETDSNIWKSVGVGHVWAISGFHMTLLGSWLFALFYLIFRLIPRLTKRIPAKYPALICSWFGLLGYLFISGTSVATIRAFLMAILVGIAIIFGRGVLTLRNGALAFLIIFLINPFYVMTAGFQLSFAAVFGLLWFFGDKEYTKRTFLSRKMHILYLSLMTAIVATIFTAPFIIAHFGYIPLYGLLGNIILLPMFSLLIMPLVVIGTICALFNYHLIISFSHDIYQFALSIAERITNLPYANINTPHVSNLALVLSIVGFLCLIFIVTSDDKNWIKRNLNYILCTIFIILAIMVNISLPRPLFYATPDHKLVGFVENGELKFNKSRASKYYFAFDSWREFNNEGPKDKNERYKCNHGLCEYQTKKWNLVYMQNFTVIFNNIENVCHDKKVNYIVAPFEIQSPNCYAKILNDGLLIYPNGHITKMVNHRPWHNPPQRNTTQMQAR